MLVHLSKLGEVLFEKLHLPHGKKGKSGNYQTDVKVLEKLKNEKIEIASLILDWRQFLETQEHIL